MKESLSTKQDFWSKSRADFFRVAEALVSVAKSGNKVLIFGNGGSACDALHFAGEWVNRYMKNRAPLPCVALTADAPLITCIANDESFDAIFERQVLAVGRSGDFAIGISTSGHSANVIRGLQAARKTGLKTLGLLGRDGGKILQEKMCDYNLVVSGSKMTPRIQETHEWILHELSDYVEMALYP